MLHKNIILSDRHAPHNYEYADSAARLAATGFVSGDVGKLAFQVSDASYWILASTTPTWSALKGEPGEPGAPGAGTGDVVGPASSVSGRVATFSGTSGKIIGDSGYSVSDLALASQRDATGGYAGLTLFKINFKNALDTFTSFFTNANTAARTYTFKDADGTIAFTSDITGTNSGTNTGDQTTVTGNAGTATALATARTIDGVSFDGTANITVVAPATFAATSKSSPVDADSIPLVDSAASNVLKKLTWDNIKATLKTYFDTLYATLASNTFTGAQIYSDQVLSRGMTKDMGMVFLDKGNSSTTAQTIDYTEGSHQKLTVTGAFVMNAVTNWPPTGNTGELLLELVDGASSAITWTMSGTTQKWWKSDGTSVSTYAASGYTFAASGTDWLLLWSTDAGTTTNIKVMR